jgi:hypothetical protein
MPSLVRRENQDLKQNNFSQSPEMGASLSGTQGSQVLSLVVSHLSLLTVHPCLTTSFLNGMIS